MALVMFTTALSTEEKENVFGDEYVAFFTGTSHMALYFFFCTWMNLCLFLLHFFIRSLLSPTSTASQETKSFLCGPRGEMN